MRSKIHTNIHKRTYLQNRLPDTENRLGCQGGGGRREMDWEFEVSRCKLSYIGWINNKILLYSTGNCIQYPVINHTEKEYEKGMRITESLCCITEIGTTL